MFKRLDFNGNPHLGVFARTNDKTTLIAPFLTDQNYGDVKEALGTELLEVTVGGGRIVGSLVAMNNRAILVSDLVRADELKRLADSGLEVGQLDARLNAAGNNVLVNGRAALVHPELAAEHAEAIGALFGVEVRAGTIAGVPTVGMAGYVTDKGILLHPRATREEVAELSGFFGVPGDIGTVNHGAPYIGAGILANTKGAVTGLATTGVEIGRIEEALKLY